jgi:isocitrate dehydrogenase
VGIGVGDAADAVVASDAVATGVGVGIGLAVGVWPGARVCFGVGVGATVELAAGSTTKAGPPALTLPGAADSVASAGAQDATARANAATPAAAAIFLRLTTMDLLPG